MIYFDKYIMAAILLVACYFMVRYFLLRGKLADLKELSLKCNKLQEDNEALQVQLNVAQRQLLSSQQAVGRVGIVEKLAEEEKEKNTFLAEELKKAQALIAQLSAEKITFEERKNALEKLQNEQESKIRLLMEEQSNRFTALQESSKNMFSEMFESLLKEALKKNNHQENKEII